MCVNLMHAFNLQINSSIKLNIEEIEAQYLRVRIKLRVLKEFNEHKESDTFSACVKERKHYEALEQLHSVEKKCHNRCLLIV